MKRAYNILKNYYAENKTEIIFKVNSSLLVIIIAILIASIFEVSVPDMENNVDDMEQCISQDISEEETDIIDNKSNFMLCHNFHSDFTNDVDHIKMYLHKESNKSFMFVDRDSLVLNYKSKLTNLRDFVDSGNIINIDLLSITWNINTYFNQAGNINTIAYNFISRSKSSNIWKRARAPGLISTSNALIDTT